MILIGSHAMNYWVPRKCKDWDLIGNLSDVIDNGEKIEIKPPDFLDTENVLAPYITQSVITDVGVCQLPDPAGLALLKRSHLHRPIGFQKHIRDYHALKKLFTPDDDWFRRLKLRTKLTNEMFGDRHPSLRKSNDDFFYDRVPKKYVHDSIHYATSYYGTPIYERLKVDKDSAWCERDLWNNLSHEDKIKCVREEGFTISLERKLIPAWDRGENYPPRFAFNYAVERICTTLCSGYFREFAIENWPEIIDYDWDFVTKFKEGLENGIVKYI